MTDADEREAPAGAATNIVGMGLVWGIKRSLLAYVRRLPDGGIAIEGEAGLTADLQFHFPLADVTDFDLESGCGLIRFTGTVRLTGHFGAMDVRIANPSLRLGPDGGVLLIDSSAGDAEGERTALLELTPAPPRALGDLQEWQDTAPVLTEAGAALFDFYPVGAPFDSLHVRVPLPAGA